MPNVPINILSENEFALRLSDVTGVDLLRQPGMKARWDFNAVSKDNGLIALVELKSRDKYTHNWFEGWMVDVTKWSSMIVYSQCCGVEFWIANAWSDADGLYIYKEGDENLFRKEFGGRTYNTRWPADIKPVIFIPTDRFEIFNRGLSDEANIY